MLYVIRYACMYRAGTGADGADLEAMSADMSC